MKTFMRRLKNFFTAALVLSIALSASYLLTFKAAPFFYHHQSSAGFNAAIGCVIGSIALIWLALLFVSILPAQPKSE